MVLLALALTLWGKGSWQGEAAESLALVQGGLLRLLENTAAALWEVRADRIPGSPHEALTTEIVTAAGDRRPGALALARSARAKVLHRQRDDGWGYGL